MNSHAFSALLLALSLLSAATALTNTTILGYTFRTDVTEHSEIDLDQQAMEAELDEQTPDFSGARTFYSSGGNSKKTDSIRTLQGFSTEAGTKLAGEGFYELFRRYYDSDTYADDFVLAALEGSGPFGAKADQLAFRAECANKGSQYQNVWMYVIHEMEDAINDCAAGTPNDNDDPAVEAWDEAVAFYTGSLVLSDGTAIGGNGTLVYTLAQKRADNFGTKKEDQVASVNRDVLALFSAGQAQLRRGECEAAVVTKNLIVRKMTIPVVQGIVRYVVLAKQDESEKSHGEGWAFLSAVLPLIANCDDDVANKLIANFNPQLDRPMPDSVEEVSGALQSVYNCLGFTCEEVGRYTITEGQDATAECRDSGEEYKVIEGTTRPSRENRGSSAGSGAGTSGSSSAGAGSGDGGGLSSGAIAGIVIAVLVVALVVAAIFAAKLRRKKGAKMGMGFVPPAEMPVEA